MQEESLRNLAADSMAQGFIVEILLTRYLKQFDPDAREQIVKSILTTGRRTDHFFGIARDEENAEEFSDVVVQMHEALDGLVSRALARTEATRISHEPEAPQS